MPRKGSKKPTLKDNQNAAKSDEEILLLIPQYLEHISKGLSKRCFVPMDYRTIEKHIEANIDLHSHKQEIEKAERQGMNYWESMGQDISSGKAKGNPATWIFTMINKYSENWKNKSEFEHSGEIKGQQVIFLSEKQRDDPGKETN